MLYLALQITSKPVLLIPAIPRRYCTCVMEQALLCLMYTLVSISSVEGLGFLKQPEAAHCQHFLPVWPPAFSRVH